MKLLIVLMTNSLNKDEMGFIEKLYNSMNVKMYKVALNILRDSFDAEDAVSRTFLIISKKN